LDDARKVLHTFNVLYYFYYLFSLYQ